jgi:hypothetical protein
MALLLKRHCCGVPINYEHSEWCPYFPNKQSHHWIGVDFDGTLAVDNRGVLADDPVPVPMMIKRVQSWLAEGIEVRIFTSRYGKVYPDQVFENCQKIQQFCLKHFGRSLTITNEKDQHMLQLWDDRAVQVINNTGIPLSEYY